MVLGTESATESYLLASSGCHPDPQLPLLKISYTVKHSLTICNHCWNLILPVFFQPEMRTQERA